MLAKVLAKVLQIKVKNDRKSILYTNIYIYIIIKEHLYIFIYTLYFYILNKII